MNSFSKRYGYTKVRNSVVRECMPVEIENSLCTAFDHLHSNLGGNYMIGDEYKNMEEFLWLNFENQRLANFRRGNSHVLVATRILQSPDWIWYQKLDMVEMAIRYLKVKYEKDIPKRQLVENICKFINEEFKRHGYAYRIVNYSIVEITSKEERESIEQAVAESKDNIRMHLVNALEAYSKRPMGDYSNSIKESISAVEGICRELTGESTLGKALKELEKKGLTIPSVMKDGLEKLYAYTNQPTTGIRHSLMDADGKYIPGNEEARYMLIVCSAFINYLRSKFATLVS